MPTQEIHRVPDAIIQAIRAYGGCRLARSNDMADQHYANAIELIGSALAAVPTQAIPQGEREAFESQFAVPHGCRNFTRDEGGYVVRQIESMWQAWLAGRASLAAIPVPEMPRELGNPWRDAILEALTVNCIRQPEHEDDPVRALADLVKWERDEAAGSAPLPPVPGLTDEQIETWADGFIREKAFNRPVALAIAFEAAKFARAALSLPKPEAAEPAPIDMVLHCPKCGAQHVDAPEGTGTFYGTDENPVELMLWDNPPHKSHFCHACGYIWCPADVPTNGVLAINTKGKDDSPIALAEPQESVDARPVAANRTICTADAMRSMAAAPPGTPSHLGGAVQWRARKVSGNYQANGTIVADFKTLAGKRRLVFEFDTPVGMLHIFDPGQVEAAAAPSPQGEA